MSTSRSRWYFAPWRWGAALLRGCAFVTLLGTMLLSTAECQCLIWVQRGNAVAVNPVGTPGQRVHHAMAYDSDRGVTVFFGGEIGKTGSESYFNDTWEYDGHTWTKIDVGAVAPIA